MSSEHKTSEAMRGMVDDDGIIKIDGSRIVGVNGPTFATTFMGPMMRKREEVATVLLAQLADKVHDGSIDIEWIIHTADTYVRTLTRTINDEIPNYFELYMETNKGVMDILEEADGDFSL